MWAVRTSIDIICIASLVYILGCVDLGVIVIVRVRVTCCQCQDHKCASATRRCNAPSAGGRQLPLDPCPLSLNMFSWMASSRLRQGKPDRGAMPFPVYHDESKGHRRTNLPKRYYRYIGAILAVFALIWFYTTRVGLSDATISVAAAEAAGRPPPLYLDYHQRELKLPQHSQDLSPPDDKDRRYFWTANHAHGKSLLAPCSRNLNDILPVVISLSIRCAGSICHYICVGSGWGNILQEMFLTTYLGYSAKRSYVKSWSCDIMCNLLFSSFVFTNYTWNKDGSAYSTFENGRKIPSQIPLSALITGPMAGGPMPAGSGAPLFVKKEWFDQVCPKSERTILRSEDVNTHLSNATGLEVLQNWVEKLNSLPDRCVEIAEESFQVFSIWCISLPV
jgi:hypothetical protein